MKEGGVHSVAFSPDGKTLAAGYGVRGRGGGVVLWDVATRKRLLEDPLPVKEGYVNSVAFSPDGKTLAAGYGIRVGNISGGVVLWDVADTQTPPGGSPPRERGRRLQRGLQPRRQDPRCRIPRTSRRRGVGGVVLWDVADTQTPPGGSPPRERGRR